MASRHRHDSNIGWRWIVGVIWSVGLATATTALAQNGTYSARTATIAESDGAAAFTFQVGAPKFANTHTFVWLELGSDDAATSAGTIGAAFVLKQVITVVTPTCLAPPCETALPLTIGMADSTTFPGKTVELVQEAPTVFPNFYELDMTHDEVVSTDETWILEVSGLPVGTSPLTRAIAFLQQATFADVDPVGPSGGGGPNLRADIAVSSGATTITFSATVENQDPDTTYTYSWHPEDDASIGTWGDTDTDTLTFTKPANVTGCCKLVTFRFEVRDDPAGDPITVNRRSRVLSGEDCDFSITWRIPPYFVFPEYIPICPGCPPVIPPRGPECLSCPPEWSNPIPEGFDRTTFLFTPLEENGTPIGPDMAGLISLSYKGGEALGGLMDRGTGEYLQVIEHPAGQAPRVTVAVGQQVADEILVGPGPSAREILYRNLLYVAGGLLLASLVAIGGLAARQGRRPA